MNDDVESELARRRWWTAINVRAASEAEMKEKNARVEGALHATRVAVEGASCLVAVSCCFVTTCVKSLKLYDSEEQMASRS